MAINAYVGLQGSGKTFEVVSSPVLDAVSQGRRIVTNVAGISEDLIHEYLVNKRDAQIDKLGQIIHVKNDRILEPQFFPDEEKPELESVVKGGDLVVVDEAWRFWGTDSGKLSHEHMQFFRMHRHYVHPETSVACDVVLMTQDITGLHRSVKNVIEFAFRMHKHKSLGFTKRYRVEIYEGWKLNGKTRIDDRQKKYNPEIFPLYQSYAGGSGTENAIDKRQNVLANKRMWIFAVMVLLLVSGGIYGVSRSLDQASESKSVSSASTKVTGAQDPSKSLSVPDEVKTTPVNTDGFSDSWHVVGEFESKKMRWVVLSNPSGKLRVESPSMFHGTGAILIGEIDGERVSRWSGGGDKSIVPQVVK
ncbi:zonular occludens toxin domain-containing protein [Undibacterium macrobrachii]|uniref:Membrane protein n=1 Tax=Undibacterium macrobrachii TaxID=1119058 RepID=A0ABQ2XF52_9BURK|nr:zonular occludens toxin domain-containing protein [Undibacterium macrobrachii]GGX14045.1 membrane protein [Undibacterium macrobrachii]